MRTSQRPRLPVAAFLVSLIAAAGLSCGARTAPPASAPTKEQRIREDQRARWAPWREAAANLFVISLELSAPALLVVGGARAWRRRRFVKVGIRGLLPVHENDLTALSAEALRSINAARRIRAGHRPGPRSVSQTLLHVLSPETHCPRCAGELAEGAGEEPR